MTTGWWALCKCDHWAEPVRLAGSAGLFPGQYSARASPPRPGAFCSALRRSPARAGRTSQCAGKSPLCRATRRRRSEAGQADRRRSPSPPRKAAEYTEGTWYSAEVPSVYSAGDREWEHPREVPPGLLSVVRYAPLRDSLRSRDCAGTNLTRPRPRFFALLPGLSGRQNAEEWSRGSHRGVPCGLG
jgi:hypothetical protein